MLKNKTQRREFLENADNWNLINDLDHIGLKIYRLDFTDGTALLRFDKKYFYKYEKIIKYKLNRLELLKNNYLDWNYYSISYATDYIMKRDLK